MYFLNNKSTQKVRSDAVTILLFTVTAAMVCGFIFYMYFNHRTYFTDRGTVTTTTVVTDEYGRSDINKATIRQISDIDGIGRKLGQNILDYIKSKNGISDMDELLEVDGIGESKLQKLCEKFYAGKSPASTTSLSSQTTVSTTTVQTLTSQTTSTVTTTSDTVTTSKKTTTTTTTTRKPERQKVNINTATPDELCRCLLIDYTQAEDIVYIRNQINGYDTVLEVLYCETITDELYLELEPYLLLK